MATRATRWTISKNQDGTYDVLRNGRTVQYRLSEAQAERHIREKSGPRDKFFEQEEDGYLVPAVLSNPHRRRTKR